MLLGKQMSVPKKYVGFILMVLCNTRNLIRTFFCCLFGACVRPLWAAGSITYIDIRNVIQVAVLTYHHPISIQRSRRLINVLMKSLLFRKLFLFIAAAIPTLYILPRNFSYPPDASINLLITCSTV
ncbi:MAG: hypothetical protein JWR18_3176 [Segetibacter sp.]|nr:hypothetical protein [Segetibacter sp.]